MGREVIAEASYAGRNGRVKVLLEGDVLIVRAPVGVRILRSDLTGARVEADRLIVGGPEGPLTVVLGAVEAARWLKALETPPPTLAAKLGLDAKARLWTWGELNDPALAEAIKGMIPASASEATLGLVRAASETALVEALEAFGDSHAPVWVIHGKGKDVFGDNSVRTAMRERGWIDTKSCAVSTTLSATRYSQRKD